MALTRELYCLLGELLEYPGPGLVDRAHRCHGLLASVRPEAAEPLAAFAAFVSREAPARIEELYTATFDLNPVCCPYVGHLLFEQDPRRPALMVKLQESYREAGFSAGAELPDHVAVMLRFLAVQGDAELEQDLVEVLLAPALAKMARGVGEGNGYGGVLRAATILIGSQEVGNV